MRLRIVILVVFLLAGWAEEIRAAGSPVAQVYLASGKAWVRSEGASADRPLARGAVLSAGDRIVLEAGAEVGIYYREGGRKVLRGGADGISGSVAALAPAIEPYRGQSVSFGATRGSAGVEADTFRCSPDEVPVFAAMPAFAFSMGAGAGETPVIASATIRVLRGESTIATASVEFPSPGRPLRLEIPDAPAGEEYTLRFILVPVASDGVLFTHSARFYVAAPGASIEDLVTPYYFCQGGLDVSFGPSVRTVRFEREWGDATGASVLSTVVTPLFTP
ncbi:MAG: hypothetical protein AAB229_06000 [Candidatus Hydrogenedentota bacterium]